MDSIAVCAFFRFGNLCSKCQAFCYPRAESMDRQKGEFIVNEHSRIVYDSPDLNKVAVLFAEDYEKCLV